MIDAREWMQIRREIRNAVQSLFFGFTDSTQINDEVATEAVQSISPGMPTIGQKTGRPVIHPYGFYSRARPTTDDKPIISVVTRQNEDPGALFIVGHRDSQRPKLDDDGDVILYDANGHTMKLSKSDGVTIDAGSNDPVTIKGKGLTYDAGNGAVSIKGVGVTVDAESGALSLKGTGSTLDGESGTAVVKSTTEVQVTDGIGTMTMTAGTFQFQGGGAELMAQLAALIEDLISAMVMTALGPQPFLPSTIALLTEVLALIESITG